MRRLFATVMVVATTAAAWGCPVGSAIGRDLNRHRGGVKIVMQFGRRTYHAELLEVRDTALVALNDRMVVLVPYVSLTAANVADAGVTFRGGLPPTPGQREAMRLVSRFPQGISPDLERKLLAMYKQTGMAPLAR